MRYSRVDFRKNLASAMNLKMEGKSLEEIYDLITQSWSKVRKAENVKGIETNR